MTPSRQASEHSFRSWDGTELFYRAWLPEQSITRAVILFHRGHEHSGRWQDVVDKLDLPDFAVFAWDARGHGGMHGGTAAAPANAVTPNILACWCGMWRRSSATFPANTASPWRTSSCSPTASAVFWRRLGFTIMRQKSVLWCSAVRRCESSCMCHSRFQGCACC